MGEFCAVDNSCADIVKHVRDETKTNIAEKIVPNKRMIYICSYFNQHHSVEKLHY